MEQCTAPVVWRIAKVERKMTDGSRTKKHEHHGAPAGRPTREEAEEAVRVLLRWTGDDPAREGLRDTPARVVRAYEEFFAGYAQDPREILKRTFTEVEGYDE